MDELRQWSHSKDNGAPRSVADFEEVEFADVLRFITEDAHLDSMVSAFAGTQEDREEPAAQIPIDGIEGDEDVAVDLDI
eukprot:277061-Karenia_brevis.AAC.1